MLHHLFHAWVAVGLKQSILHNPTDLTISPKLQPQNRKIKSKNIITATFELTALGMVYISPVDAISSFFGYIWSIIWLLRAIYTLPWFISPVYAGSWLLFMVCACTRLFFLINTLQILPLIHAGSGFLSKIYAVPRFVKLIRNTIRSSFLMRWLLNDCDEFLEVLYILRVKLQITVISSFNP